MLSYNSISLNSTADLVQVGHRSASQQQWNSEQPAEYYAHSRSYLSYPKLLELLEVPGQAPSYSYADQLETYAGSPSLQGSDSASPVSLAETRKYSQPSETELLYQSLIQRLIEQEQFANSPRTVENLPANTDSLLTNKEPEKNSPLYYLLVGDQSTQSGSPNDNQLVLAADNNLDESNSRLSHDSKTSESFLPSDRGQEGYSERSHSIDQSFENSGLYYPIDDKTSKETSKVIFAETKSAKDVSKKSSRSEDGEERPTTLVEDEEIGTFSDRHDQDKGKLANSTHEAQVETTTANYGTVVSAHSDAGNRDATGSATTVFSEMYKKLAAYLPFLHQVSIPNGRSEPEAMTTKSDIVDQAKTSEEAKNHSRAVTANIGEQDKEVKPKPSSFRLSSSKLTSVGSKPSEGTEDNSVSNDKEAEGSDSDEKSHADQKVVSEDSSGKSRLRNPHRRLYTKMSDYDQHNRNGDDTEYVGQPTRAYDGHRVSLMRQSSLILPLESKDSMLVQSEAEHPGSLLGKYVYAPAHHYHLGGPKSLDVDESHTARHVYSRRFQPGDEVYGSYRPMFGQHLGNGLGGVEPNKSNDLYFLVMVAAFCVMAMAVVLAAGLFAYRVQQNRKPNSDADCPTYGVVGPNNMSSKCGASALVSGYFGAPGQGASYPSSKAGSVKHLADTCSASDSGVTTSTKSVSKKASNDLGGGFVANQNAARMYHYQHQKKQMIISDRVSNGRQTSASDLDSEEEDNDEGYTVYECPGLASAHEMEIKNPLFNDDQTP